MAGRTFVVPDEHDGNAVEEVQHVALRHAQRLCAQHAQAHLRRGDRGNLRHGLEGHAELLHACRPHFPSVTRCELETQGDGRSLRGGWLIGVHG